MKLKLIITGIVILIIGLGLGSYLDEYLFVEKEEQYIPKLIVLGDVENILAITGLEEYDPDEFVYQNEEFLGIDLRCLIGKASPITDRYTIQLMGTDGLTAEFPGDNLTGCYITFTQKHGWEAINLHHPVSSNIKSLQEITIIADGSNWDRGMNLMTTEKNLLNITPGQALANSYTTYLNFEGSAQLENDDIDYQTKILTRKRILQLKDLLPEGTKGQILVFGKKGETTYHQEGFLEISGNRFNYLSPTRKEEIDNIQGIMINPPVNSIADTFYDAEHYLETGERVLIFLIDGFGYHQYTYVVEHGLLPFMSTLQPAKQALSVYRPVTNAGMAAMITGVGPEKNGVYSRAQKDMLVPDIFTIAEKTGKKSLLIEGDIKILNTGVEPILNLDTNGNGTKDDEIFTTAMENLSTDISLMFVHFHGVDDLGTEYGDLADETLDFITLVDGYIAQLVQGWSGKVIITADHGMHQIPGGGLHGVARFEDLIVPYIITEGGGKNE